SLPAAEIRKTIEEEIASLDFHPATNQARGHYREQIQTIIPDLSIHWNDHRLIAEVNDASLPNLRFNPRYLQLLNEESLSEETRRFIQEKLTSGKWLARNLQERHQTLYRIAEQLIEIQSPFFSHPNGKLVPITMKEIAERLELHESTIARAVANKYILTPRGTLPLRFFFTHAYVNDKGENVSAKTVKELVQKIIAEENKTVPFSDETISSMIKEKGIPCARRTVAKYSQELGIGNTVQRKQY
ncbi:MAG TPA: RNA polymerase sigma-54 factor, partial [Myxococcota bacterium]|nr:RNA polymerase sigma-54 factor [Myxococcota bacterium]